MQSDDFQDQLSANTMGVAIKNVASVKTLKTLSAVVPSLEDQGKLLYAKAKRLNNSSSSLLGITRQKFKNLTTSANPFCRKPSRAN